MADGTVECLHFRHEHVIAVRGLGGHCYKMDDDIENEDHADDGEPTKIGEREGRNSRSPKSWSGTNSSNLLN